MIHQLPELPYAYDELEPYLDAATMEIHHTKHHQAYVDKLNAALEGHPEWQDKPVETLLTRLELIPQNIRTAVRNHGGGHFNHSFFWPMLKKDTVFGGGVADAIQSQFGGFDAFKTHFASACMGLAGTTNMPPSQNGGG